MNMVEQIESNSFNPYSDSSIHGVLSLKNWDYKWYTDTLKRVKKRKNRGYACLKNFNRQIEIHKCLQQ